MSARRDHLLEELSRHDPLDREEQADLERMVAFAREHEAPFDRALVPGHFTGSGLVADADLDQVVLLHHRKLDMWLQCGGHAHPEDRTGLDVALREAQEETGLENVGPHPAWPRLLDVDIHEIPATASMPAHQHLDLRYLLVADPDQPLEAPDDEAKAVGWFTWEQTEVLDLDDGLVRLLDKAVNLAGPRGF